MMGGLRLPDSMGVGETDQQNIHNSWETYAHIGDELLAKKVGISPTPEQPCPNVTEKDLRDPDKAHILNAQLLEWARYSSENLAAFRSNMIQIKNEKREIAAVIRKAIKESGGKAEDGSKLTVDDIQDRILLDPRYKTLTLLEQQYTQREEHFTTVWEHADRSLKALSRSIEFTKVAQSKYNGSSSATTGSTGTPATKKPSGPWKGR